MKALHVHVTLSRELVSEEMRHTVVRAFEEKAGMKGINYKLLDRFGILSGDVDIPFEQVQKLGKTLKGVTAVEADEVRHIL